MADKQNDSITITTLGASGAGKTCFLVGMYAIMRAGVRGFTFAARDLDQDLVLSNWWDQLLIQQGKNRWPPPNDNNPIEYEFDLCYGLNTWKSFTWFDYRGSALRDKQDVSDVKRLQQYFSKSDSVFLCLPADQFARGQRDASIGRMTQYLSDLRKSGRQPDIAIILTKGDLLGSQMKADQVVERVQKWFEPLFVSGACQGVGGRAG